MASLNKVILIGNLTANPELKTTPSGASLTNFSIAVHRKYKDQNGSFPTDFINIVAWRQTAEFVSKYFSKGDAICICGSIQTRTYTDQQGNKRYVTEVVADEATFAGGPKKATPSADDIATAQPYPAAKHNSVVPTAMDFQPLDESEELPF